MYSLFAISLHKTHIVLCYINLSITPTHESYLLMNLNRDKESDIYKSKGFLISYSYSMIII